LDIEKEIKELKENQNHWATLENVTVCRLGIEDLEEVLRGLLEMLIQVGKEQHWLYSKTRFGNILRGLGGEKTVNEVNNPMSSGSGMKTETDSKPPSCEFCGRDLIYYEEKWICGHGYIKTAVNPSEQDVASSASHTVDYPCEKSKDGRHDFFYGFGIKKCKNCHKTDIEIKEKEPTDAGSARQTEKDWICTPKEQEKCFSFKSILCLSPKITTCMHGKSKLAKLLEKSVCSKCNLKEDCLYSFEKDKIKNKDYFDGCHDFKVGDSVNSDDICNECGCAVVHIACSKYIDDNGFFKSLKERPSKQPQQSENCTKMDKYLEEK